MLLSQEKLNTADYTHLHS